jgi:hypothetical protein
MRQYTGVLRELWLVEGIAAMAGVCLKAPRGAQKITDVRFVGQCDPVGLGSVAEVRLSPDLSTRSGAATDTCEQLTYHPKRDSRKDAKAGKSLPAN